MNKISPLVKYICDKYPYADDLSKARLTKMVYLTDWEYAKKYKKQLTDIEWYFNNYGPFVDDVIEEVERDPEIELIRATTIYGTPKIQIKYKGGSDIKGLSEQEKAIADEVIDRTKPMFWNAFIKYVYDTPPIKENTRYSTLNLVELANKEQ